MATIDFSYDFTGHTHGDYRPPEVATDGGTWKYFSNGLFAQISNGTNALLLSANTAGEPIIASFRASDNDNTKPAVIRKEIDADNYIEFRWRASDGQCAVSRYNGGVSQNYATQDTSSQGSNYIAKMEMRPNGTSIEMYLDDALIFTEVDEALANSLVNKLTVLNNNYALTYAEFSYDSEVAKLPAPPLDLPYTIAGRRSQVVKHGKIFGNISSNDEDRELWNQQYSTENIAGWNTTEFPNNTKKYPVYMVSGSDHAGGLGGIQLRVYEERGLYDLRDADSWHEWQDISNLPEFAHITKKTNPIFRDSVDTQTETPTIVFKDGVAFLFYHCTDVNVPNTGVRQATKYATSTNGIDFVEQGILDLELDADYIEGDGHDGYFYPGENKIYEIPYAYIGTKLNGGGDDTSGSSAVIQVSNDLVNWERYAVYGKNKGFLEKDYPLDDGFYYRYSRIFDLKKEGPYYRATMGRKNGGSGGQASNNTMVEILVNKDLNPVSKPEILLEPTAGTFDELQVGGLSEITYHGVRYGFYITRTPEVTSEIGVCTIEEVSHDWEIGEPLTDRTEVLSLETGDSTPVTAGITYNQSVAYKSEAGYNYTSLTLPLNGDVATAIADTGIRPIDHDYIDIIFENIGKDSSHGENEDQDDIELYFGVTDDLDNPTNQMAYYWSEPSKFSSTADRSRPMRFQQLPSGTDYVLSNYYGNTDDWKQYGNQGEESAQAKHVVGFRLQTSELRTFILEGISEEETFGMGGVDQYATLYPFIKARLVTPQAADTSVSFMNIKIVTYSADKVVVPDAPVMSSSNVTATGLTLAASAVTGATGYKYYAGESVNETGVFDDLNPETDYIVYARASDANGDSEPSNIATITTLADENDTKPTAVITAPSAVETGTQVQVTGVNSSDEETPLTVYAWTLTVPAGSSATLDDRFIVDPVFTPDIDGTYSLSLVVTDSTDNPSAPVTKDIVADTAYVNQKPVIDTFTGPQTASAGNLSEYVVTANDPENDSLSYEFTIDSTGPAVTLDINGNECSFTAVQNATEYSVTITVRAYDGELYSDPVSITNVVEAFIEQPPETVPAPIAIITGPETVEAGKDVTLKAYVIGDANEYTYEWILEDGGVQLIPNGNELSFTAPINQIASMVKVGVIARAGELVSEKATFTTQVDAEPEKSTLRIKVAGLDIGLRDITLFKLSNPTEPLFKGEVLVSKNRVNATVYAPKGTTLIGWHVGTNAPFTTTCIYGVTE